MGFEPGTRTLRASIGLGEMNAPAHPMHTPVVWETEWRYCIKFSHWFVCPSRLRLPATSDAIFFKKISSSLLITWSYHLNPTSRILSVYIPFPCSVLLTIQFLFYHSRRAVILWNPILSSKRYATMGAWLNLKDRWDIYALFGFTLIPVGNILCKWQEVFLKFPSVFRLLAVFFRAVSPLAPQLHHRSDYSCKDECRMKSKRT